MYRNVRGLRDLIATVLLLLLASGCAHGGRPDGPAAGAGERPPADPSSVRSDEIIPTDDVDEILRGRVAGVRVLQAPGGIIVHIRGTTSIMGDNQPLYVIDGLPVEAAPDGSVPVQPYDIESIRVLKDAVDTSMYGVRGANGVIVITTKRPPQSDPVVMKSLARSSLRATT